MMAETVEKLVCLKHEICPDKSCPHYKPHKQDVGCVQMWGRICHDLNEQVTCVIPKKKPKKKRGGAA